jgi:hypothetical protein
MISDHFLIDHTKKHDTHEFPVLNLNSKAMCPAVSVHVEKCEDEISRGFFVQHHLVTCRCGYGRYLDR